MGNNYQDYRSKKESHVSSLEKSEETFSTKVPFFSWLVGYEETETTSSSTFKSNDFEKEIDFFSETSGEIYIYEVHCELYNVKVSPFQKPIFTSAFISAMQGLNKAAQNSTAKSSKDIVKTFINTYGTHYQAESWLGASLTTETRIASRSTGAKQKQKRSSCIAQAYGKAMRSGISVREVDVNGEVELGKGAKVGASTTVGGWSIGSEDAYGK